MKRPYLILIALALLFSGFAGLNNQVIWQRSLKTILGGGESLSMTIVVLVFMLGLGVGSYLCSRKANTLKSPIATFILVEFLLCCTNALVCWLFTLDLSSTVFSVCTYSIKLGVSIQIIYTAFSTLILLIPCILMGITIPLTAEVCQRNLQLKSPAVISSLIAINTMGSVLGVLLSGTILLPQLGLTNSLIFAIGASAAAVVALIALGFLCKWKTSMSEEANISNADTTRINTNYLFALSFLLGLCSLAYEMYLFRFCTLLNTSLPQIFSAVVIGFLVFWSIGAFLSSSKLKISLSMCNFLLILSLATVFFTSLIEVHPQSQVLQTLYKIPSIVLLTTVAYLTLKPLKLSTVKKCLLALLIGTSAPYLLTLDFFRGLPDENPSSLIKYIFAKSLLFSPCLFFGFLFGRIISTKASSWGNSVGKFYVFNTLGSTVGIALAYFVFSYLSHYNFMVAILLLLTISTCLLFKLAKTFDSKLSIFSPSNIQPYIITLICILTSLIIHYIPTTYKRYNGKEGVLKLYTNGTMTWDGLWHSALSKNNSHVGTKNWYLSTIPTLCHNSTENNKSVCVIGVGTGITASTFSKFDKFSKVDAYDINHTLKTLLEEHSEGTLNYINNKKINTFWMDARAGLILSEEKYDIIQTQPMYLKQAGSSLLNSIEFFQLVQQRLKKDGIFCLYSNGTPEQAFVVRETADKVFPYRESFFNGYMIILSNQPIVYSKHALEMRLEAYPNLALEFQQSTLTKNIDQLVRLIDKEKLPSHNKEIFISDDYPIIEYQYNLKKLLKNQNIPFSLPKPGQQFNTN